MTDLPLIKPEEIKLTDQDGKERTYILSKIPASYSKQIILQYPATLLPKVGSFDEHEKIVFQMFSYVGVPQKDKPPLRLSSRELCDNHIPDFKTWMALEKAVAQYNWGFFLNDDLSNFWVMVKANVSTFIQQTLTASLQQSSQTEKPPLTTSEPFTR